jgi:dTDP-4-amino-4,6-dideoxygalactose transaminase
MADTEKLAVLGGRPVRAAPWPKWPLFTDQDVAVLGAVLRDGRLTSITGPKVQEFEQAFAAKFGSRHAVATCNGVTALHLALAALGVGPGDEVIVPAHTFIGTAIPVLMANAVPVFVDVDLDTFNIDPAKIEAAITERTRALLPVHLNGLAADLDAVFTLAGKHGLPVIEDACQAHGGTYKGRTLGTLGRIGAFSFFEDKVITTGEGGMLITDDDGLYEQARRLRSYGEERVTSIGERKYEHVALGFNYRMGALNAAVGLGQLPRLEAMVEKRNRNAAYLRRRLLEEAPGILPPKEVPGCRHAYYKFVCRIDRKVLEVDAPTAVEAIKAEGVAATPRYPTPLPLQKVFREKIGYGGTDCPYGCRYYGREPAFLRGSWPVAERIGKEAFVLLVHPSIEEPDLEDAVRAVRKVAAHYRE